jgi:uncharacterized protein (TIGR02186 family)
VQNALAAIFTISSLWLVPAAAWPEETRLKVTPEIVRMGAFYGGAAVRVEGVTGPDEKVVIVVRGQKVTEVFNKAGRVGPIWVNTGKVTISEVPSLLLVFSSEPVNACLTRAVIDKYGLDLPALKKQIRIESKMGDDERVADDYFRYKANQGSYRLEYGGIQMNQPNPDGLSYRLEFVLPKCAPPGQYQISVLKCRKGEVVESSDVPLKVVEVGFPSLVAWLAAQHPSSYGILSVVIALLAGFGIDFVAARVFKRRMTGH